MDFNELELLEGLRWSWHSWPNIRKEASKAVVPFGVMCTPLMPLPDLPLLPYDALTCRTCRGVLNPYCRVDFQTKFWNCCFCCQRNIFPPSYSSISESNLPGELFPTHTSVEYVLPPSLNKYSVTYPTENNTSGPGFLFVLDTCMNEEDLGHLKVAIMQCLSLLPENSLIGLVTFGTMVCVHELSYLDCCKSIVLHGERELSSHQVQELLSISTQQPKGAASWKNPFLLPISECEFMFTNALEEVHPNSFPVEQGNRPCRATGAALAVATGLMEGCKAIFGGRIMLFVAGPTTIGPGMIVETDLGKSIRTHQDLINDNTPYHKKACKFYKDLAEHLVGAALVLDIFACSLDQVGIDEARVAVESSGGVIVLAETFDSDQFKKSLQRMFVYDKGHLKMCFNATLEVMTTQEVKLCGAIGPCLSLKKKTTAVSSNEVGIGGTNSWRMSTLAEKTCIALYFEVANQASSTARPGTAFFLQFLTKYQSCSGEVHMCVTTTARRWIDGGYARDLAEGFDQEAAVALVARLAVFKTQTEDVFDIIRWLDRMLIRFASTFGDYVKEDPTSFRLSSNLSLFPQFIFYLRRSQFLQVFNSTPDETSFFRSVLNREGVVGSVIMIQPTLISYSFDGPPMAVVLDVSSIDPNRILLFDSYFYVVVHYGSNIAQWRKQGYQNDPSYETFRKLLEAPLQDAQTLLAERFPVPKLIECDQHSSQARFLLAKINPSVTHNSERAGESEVVFTDDVSLQVFIAHLQKLAVQD